jgi:hypothetical protein
VLLLPLDTRSMDHARNIMMRSFEQLNLSKNPWERVLSNILSSITAQYPHVIGLVDSPHLQKLRQNDGSDNTSHDDHKIPAKTIYCICIDMSSSGQPSASTYAHDQFFGKPLLQLPEQYGKGVPLLIACLKGDHIYE